MRRMNFFFNLPNPSGRTRPWGLLSLYQRWVPGAEKWCFWGAERGWCVGLTTLPPSMSRLYRHCGILNISQPYRPYGDSFTFSFTSSISMLCLPWTWRPQATPKRCWDLLHYMVSDLKTVAITDVAYGWRCLHKAIVGICTPTAQTPDSQATRQTRRCGMN
jgi:hypothetical protein